MTLYLVTQSYHYYPRSGDGDWRSIHTDKAEARRAFAERGGIGLGSTVFLIQLSQNGWNVLDTVDVR